MRGARRGEPGRGPEGREEGAMRGAGRGGPDRDREGAGVGGRTGGPRGRTGGLSGPVRRWTRGVGVRAMP
eukprot:7975227-Pyramimonas_sp.AAC.1